MAINTMKICTTAPYIIREMQIKMRYLCTPIRMAKSKKLIMPSCSKDAEEWELSFITGGMQNSTVWEFLMLLNIDLAYDPLIALLGIYPSDVKAVVTQNFSILVCVYGKYGDFNCV